MQTYIIVSMVMNIIAVGILLQKTTSYDYSIPRYGSKGGDVFTMVLAICFSIWAGSLII